MSSDTMPCGCDGHADNARLCRYPALESAFRQAEQERDELKRRFEVTLDERVRLHADLQRAEADNAALLALATERGCLDLGPSIGSERPSSCNLNEWPDDASCPACRATRTAHPGAALLERHAKEVAALRVHEAEMAESLRNALARMRVLGAVLAKFREAEWLRGDWQGICPFRRHKNIQCPGTDGRVAPVGTPSPVPHDEHCPYHALDALEKTS